MEVLASVVGAVVSSTVTKLLTVIGKESGDLKLDAESIQRELDFIYAKVRDEPPDSTRSSNIRKEWMVELRRLADDIEDCIYSFHVRKKTSNSKRQFARTGCPTQGQIKGDTEGICHHWRSNHDLQ